MTVRLVDLPLPVLLALRDGEDDTAASILGLDIPAEFAAHVEIWTFMITLLEAKPANKGWTMNAIVTGDTIVGNGWVQGRTQRRRRGRARLHRAHSSPPSRSCRGRHAAARRSLPPRAVGPRAVRHDRTGQVASIATIKAAGFTPAGDRLHERWGRQLVFRHDLVSAR